jgi:hypothetical protein
MTAAMQAKAIQSASTDAPQAKAQPTASTDTGGGGGGKAKPHWSETLPEGVDAQWVRNLKNKLVKTGAIPASYITSEALSDAGHRKRLNRMLRDLKKQKTEKPEPEVEEGEGEETAPETPPEPTQAQPRITVFPTGRFPKGRMVDRPTTGLPGPGGWVPAGEGLWWPPYPTTAGPMARPELEKPTVETGLDYTLNAAGQSAALEGGR